MAGMRIVYENVIDTITVLTATSSVGTLVPANMTTDLKDEVWRSVGTSAILTLQWPAPQTMTMPGLMFTNLTATATIRVQGFTLPTDSIAQFDTGVVSACAYAPLGNLNWGTQPLGVNAFRFGGISHGRAYFNGNVAKLLVTLADTGNPNGYLEIARLVAGSYWSPDCNPEYGAEFTYKFNTQHEESQSGDLRTERRPRRRGMNFNLAWLQNPADQFAMHEIMLAAGMDKPIFVSLFPEHTDPVIEQRCQMFAKLDGDHSMTHPSYGVFSAPLRLLEI